MKHVVMCSSGVGSAVAGWRVSRRFGTDDLTLLFADVNMEHPDNYRFLKEASAWIGGDLVVLDNGGKTIWDVFRDKRFIGNTRVDLCSRVLKREPMRKWLEDHCDPADTMVHLGFDISEEHRVQRAAPYWVPWDVQAPLCWDPVIWKDQAIDILNRAGIEAPLLTRQGFPHANCGGGCVKAGIGQFKKLYDLAPDTYAEWERNERELRQTLGKVSILRDRRAVERLVKECSHPFTDVDEGGIEIDTFEHFPDECPSPVMEMRKVPTTTPMSLSQLRYRMGDVRTLNDMLTVDPGDSCNCMGDVTAD